MSKKLAIIGHSTRGEEVIELLEMMGGNVDKKILSAANIGDILNPRVYFFDPDSSDNRIVWYYLLGLEADGRASEMMIFTLEEFLEKYPFKVGDKVIDEADGCPGVVCEMKWDEGLSDMKYCVAFGNGIDFGWYANYSINFFNIKKNENLEENKLFGTVINSAETKSYTVSLKDDKVIDNSIESVQFIQSGKIVAVRFNTQNYENEVELQLDDYEIVVRDGRTYAVKKKPKYPTTYDECCQNLGCDDKISNKKLVLFSQLINARNAYWNIAGEQMGLGKPWKPDLGNEELYCIQNYNKQIIKSKTNTAFNKILIFPTEEMQDAFYENFKDLIEQCKELL